MQHVDSGDDCYHAVSIFDDSSPRSMRNNTIAFPNRTIYEWTLSRHLPHCSTPSPMFDWIVHRRTSIQMCEGSGKMRIQTGTYFRKTHRGSSSNDYKKPTKVYVTCNNMSRNCCASCKCFSNNCNCTFRSILDVIWYNISACFRPEDSISCKIQCPVR